MHVFDRKNWISLFSCPYFRVLPRRRHGPWKAGQFMHAPSRKIFDCTEQTEIDTFFPLLQQDATMEDGILLGNNRRDLTERWEAGKEAERKADDWLRESEQLHIRIRYPSLEEEKFNPFTFSLRIPDRCLRRYVQNWEWYIIDSLSTKRSLQRKFQRNITWIFQPITTGGVTILHIWLFTTGLSSV